MIAKGYQFEIITDIGSGINYNKKGKRANKAKKMIKELMKDDTCKES